MTTAAPSARTAVRLSLAAALMVLPTTALAGSASSPQGSQCATENGTCSFKGTRTVFYGAGSTWTTRTLSNGTPCDNATFGDPLRGTVKSCYVMPSVVSQAPRGRQCATEGGSCDFSGTHTVVYGAGSSWVARVASGGSACNNSTFGDPIVGTVKACYVMDVGKASAPQGRECATENGTCQFAGVRTVYYGAGETWYTREASGSVACDNSTFGDPIVGTVKACYVDDSASQGTRVRPNFTRRVR